MSTLTPHTTYILSGHLVAEQPLATCSKDLADREGGSGKPIPVPSTQTADGRALYFPATGIRGALRRHALSAIHDILREHTGVSAPFSLDQHYLHVLGGIKGSGDTNRASVKHLEQARVVNPHLSLFGAGDAGDLGFVKGRLHMGNAFAPTGVRPAVFSGARTDAFYRDPEMVKRLSPDDVAALVLRAQGGRGRKEIEDDIKALKLQKRALVQAAGDKEAGALIDAKIEALQADLVQLKSDTGTSDVSVGMPLAGYQAIPAGVSLTNRMHLMNSDAVELGLLLAGLAQWSMSPVLGAHHSTGCGMISGQWDVFTPTLTGKVFLGTVLLTPFEGLQVTGEALLAAQAAFADFMAAKRYDFAIPTLPKTAKADAS